MFVHNSSPFSATPAILILIGNIAVILLDIFAFIGVVHQTWGLWRLKQNSHLRDNKDLVTSLLRQGWHTRAAWSEMPLPLLSTIIICEFTLDLRQRNIKESNSNQSAMDLPSLSFHENPAHTARSVLGRLRESIITEMGERNDLVDIDNAYSEEPLEDLQLGAVPNGSED
ncbi:hypothetical protein Clacol_003417 [Clathrus columnatus]|uniref:Uncharacterized protein n=1 Tax=Clathrus columnatus TaxID=1419009 RepID=A0AAV5A4I5_9AGAM|nr:hypothetical protein Clacol_003417 [Clathrus columnatus]